MHLPMIVRMLSFYGSMYLYICLQLYVCTCPYLHLFMTMFRLKQPAMPRSHNVTYPIFISPDDIYDASFI